jgi:hypothetical protein
VADPRPLIEALRREHGEVDLPSGGHGGRREKCNPRDPEQIYVMRVLGGGPCLCGADAHNARVEEALAAVEEERANADRLTAMLERAREYVAAAAAPEESYGAGAGCDPREFTPDPECSTEEERARHAADCEKAARGEPIDTLTGCHVEGAALVSYQGWGLGTYVYRDEEAGRALADLDDALAAHRAHRGGQ